MDRPQLRIEWRRLLVAGETCPRCRVTGEAVAAAVEALERSLAPLGVSVALDTRELTEEEFRANPLASNEILVNGKPLESWLGGATGSSPCCDVCGDSVCRTLELDGQTFEAIPAELVVSAGIRAAAAMLAASCGCGRGGEGSGCCP